MPQEIILETYHGTVENDSGRCIYNLRLVHKVPLDKIDYKCAFECNGANKCNGSVNLCDFYIDSEDYYNQICALRARAKRKKDKEMLLTDGDMKCLDCIGTENKDCEQYVNVAYVVNEICGHKARVERKTRQNFPLIGLEENCAACLGDKNILTRCDNFYSMRDFHEFAALFEFASNAP